jgi:GNAT superfamily N-acetyltransferase
VQTAIENYLLSLILYKKNPKLQFEETSKMAIPELPSASSRTLVLAQATQKEKETTWRANFFEWGKALSNIDYYAREDHLTRAPLARDKGITHWVLVDGTLSPDERPILASCESLKKTALVRSPKDGEHVKEMVCHGIGSVFCAKEYRGRGYASRMMTELGEKLKTWQGGENGVAFSVLYSDIGKKFYAEHGWVPFASTHIEFLPTDASSEVNETGREVKLLTDADIPALCETDSQLINQGLLAAHNHKTHVAILPNLEHMGWHREREIYMCDKIFAKVPESRGAIVGDPGQRIWAIWTRSYYEPLAADSHNTLHILRLVIEDELEGADDDKLSRQALGLRKVIEEARKQAKDWKLRHVELWNPDPVVRNLVDRTGLPHKTVEREKDSIASLMWYGQSQGTPETVEWVKNEKFGWC